MCRFWFSCALLLGLYGQAAAHDFWVQPDAYWPAPDALTALTLQVGHGPDRQRSPIPLRRILRFEAIAPDGSAVDLRAGLHPGGAADGAFALGQPGTFMLVLQTDDQAMSFLPALRFNDYVEAEGLTPARMLREAARRMDAEGAERYSRVTKAILQIGPAGDAASVTRPLGLPLEIVPELDPYAVPRPASLPVRVFYDGQPLAGALVKLTDLEHDAAPLDRQRTDAMGRARFALPTRGSWLLNVVWTRPSPRSEATDFDTCFSSLSFGFPPDGSER